MDQISRDILHGIDHPSKNTVVLHGCNCMHIMGAGIAAYLREMYPQVYEADLATPKFNTNKMGTYSVAVIRDDFHILNCYTQFGIGADKYGNPPIDYNATQICLQRVARTYKDWSIRLPMIGCGLAGGNWDKMKGIIETELGHLDCAIYLGQRR